MSNCCESSKNKEQDLLIKDTKWLKIAFWLLISTFLFTTLEAVVAITSGYSANSVVLMGFGLDSIIEMSASGLMVWRLAKELSGSDPEMIERTESSVHRFVGVSFFVLSAYIVYDSVTSLLTREIPQESWAGIGIAILAFIGMPLLAWGKLKAAKKLNSGALRAEAKESIACSILALILLLGLFLNASFDWWWADPVAGLLMLPWLLKEGFNGLQGKGCS